MAQIHLIFIRLPDKKIVTLRHDWLFGQTVVRKLKNLIEFFRNAPASLLKDEEIMRHVLSMIYSDFRNEYVSIPTTFENNNGVTVIDFSTDFRYCFMSTGVLDCHGKNAFRYSKQGSSCFKPLSASVYLSAYYPNEIGDLRLDAQNQELIAYFAKKKVLPLAQVKKICPQLFE